MTKPTYAQLLEAAKIVAQGYEAPGLGGIEGWQKAWSVIETADAYSKEARSHSKKTNGLATEAANPLISNEKLAEWTEHHDQQA